MYQQAEDMKTTENIDVNCIEPQYEYQGLVSTIHPPDYWRNLDSSKSRTKQEEEAGKRIILDLLNNQPSNSAVAFTDGSCSGNPRPCGSGAIIFHKEEEIELKRAVSNRGSILPAEIIAIKIVLDYFVNSKDQELHNITIFPDSQSALGILTLNWKSDNYFQSINEIKSQINYLKEQGVVVSFNWTPGHASIKGSEIADQLAKGAAKEAETLELSTQVFTKKTSEKLQGM